MSTSSAPSIHVCASFGRFFSRSSCGSSLILHVSKTGTPIAFTTSPMDTLDWVVLNRYRNWWHAHIQHSCRKSLQMVAHHCAGGISGVRGNHPGISCVVLRIVCQILSTGANTNSCSNNVDYHKPSISIVFVLIITLNSPFHA